MAGIDRNTGKLLAGWPHVVQSLHVLFTTSFGSRVMRRYFGSQVPQLLGNNLVPSTITRFLAAVITAIELWEPRFRVVKVDIDATRNTPESLRLGRLAMTVRGEYRPRALEGDFTPARGEYFLTVGLSGGSIEVQAT